jgi:hypothetical protein
MSIEYQRADAHLIDYGLYELPGLPRSVRSPALIGDEFIACLGSAHTFGRFVQKPYPMLLSQALGVETLNLGFGSAGPSFFLNHPALLEHANRARIVILQVLSGRSQANSLFDLPKYNVQGFNKALNRDMGAGEFYTWLLEQGPEMARTVLAETRKNYVAATRELLRAIRPPKILFWFSTRRPDYTEQFELPIRKFFGAFPQFVNRAMIDAIQPLADAYVECVSRRGSPQPIVDLNGQPSSFRGVTPSDGEEAKTKNHYYPSPEMHEDAAAALAPVCRAMLDGRP